MLIRIDDRHRVNPHAVTGISIVPAGTSKDDLTLSVRLHLVDKRYIAWELNPTSPEVTEEDMLTGANTLADEIQAKIDAVTVVNGPSISRQL